MFYSNVLSIALTVLLSVATPSLAAPLMLMKRKKKKPKTGGGHVTYYGGHGNGNGKPLSKKAAIIVAAVISGIVGLVLLGILIFFLWKKYDIGDRLRERRRKREIEKMEKIRNEQPFVAERLFEPSPSTPHDASDQATLVAPPSPYSKSGSVASSPSENHVALPAYSPTARSSSEQLAMPVPVHVDSHADHSAPVPYTRELSPDSEGERAGGWREKLPFLRRK